MTDLKDYKAVGPYIRVSSDKQETGRQRSGIEGFVGRYNLPVAEWFEDSQGLNSRDLAEDPNKRKEFKRMIQWVKEGKLDCIIVDEQDRFGMADHRQWTEYLGILEDHDCDLIDINGRKFTGDDMGTVFTGLVGQMTSTIEQIQKSKRVTSGKYEKAIAGEYQGGMPPYGLDVVCFGPDGNEKWRWVAEGHDKRLKVSPDGSEERFDGKGNTPKKNLTDTLRLRPSIREDRIRVVAQIFHWFTTESITPRAIAKRLNDLGIPAVYMKETKDGLEPMWYKHNVFSVLTQPNYLGRFVWNKHGKGRFWEHVGGETKRVPKAKGKAKAKKTSKRVRPEADFAVAHEQFEPLVSMEVWQEAQRRLEKASEKPHGTKGRHAPHNSGLWLRPFLVCWKCSKPMHGHAGRSKTGLAPSYFCGMYNRHGATNPSGCKCHRVRHDVLEKLVLDYVQEKAPKLLDALNEAGTDAPEFKEPMLAKLRDLQQAVENMHCEALDYAIRNDAEGVPFEKVLAKVRPEVEAVIAEKEAELDKMLEAYATLPPRIQERYQAKMAVLGDEIAALKSRLVDVTAPMADFQSNIERLRAEFAQALTELGGENNGRRKAEVIGRLIGKVVCQFEYKGKSERSRLVGVTIMPALTSDASQQSPEFVGVAEGCTAKSTSAEVSSQQNFVSELLKVTYQAAEIVQINPPVGTTRKHANYDRAKHREIGKRAAAAKWAKARSEGRPNSLTPEQRSANARKASLASHAKRAAAKASRKVA